MISLGNCMHQILIKFRRPLPPIISFFDFCFQDILDGALVEHGAVGMSSWAVRQLPGIRQRSEDPLLLRIVANAARSLDAAAAAL